MFNRCATVFEKENSFVIIPTVFLRIFMKKITDIIKKSLKNDVTRTVSIDPDSIIASLAESSIPQGKDEEWKYRIEDEIGRGGIGRVLIAFDERVGREIALKELIKEDNPGKATIAPLDKMKADELRFLREAKVTGQLEHPGIVPVYEIGRKPDGNHYYTMRLVRGVTLSEAISDAGTLEKRLRLLPHFRDICNAIAYSHSRGVIHRDIKPENIMIGEFGETVVLDWGLAKVKGETDSAEGELREELSLLKVEHLGKTVRGKAIGTPAYMSPEQAKGEISEIDERSDIYSLGAVLYEILTGHPPFKGRDVKETLEMVKSNSPVEITLYETMAPPDLCAVVGKTLTRDKDSRYQSAMDVAREIENFMSGGRIKAYEYSSWELFKRFTIKNKLITGLIGILSLVLISGSMVILYAYGESVKNERTAHLNLSMGYLEYAERLLKEKKYLNAKVFSAAALYHNPYNPKSFWSFPDYFINENIEESASQMLSIQSALYLSTVHQNDSFKEDFAKVNFDARVVVVSPDGSLVAVAGKRKRVSVYSMSTGKLKFELGGHNDEISAIEFSPDGRYIASGSWDKKLNVWDARSGILIKSVEVPSGEIYATAFSSDSRYIIYGGTDRHVWISDMTDFHLKAQKILKLENSVRSLTFSLSGNILASDSFGSIYFIENRKLKAVFRQHSEPVIAVKFLKDENFFISTGYDKKFFLWNVSSSLPLYVYEYWDAFFDLDISSDGTLAAAASRDGTVKLIDLRNRIVEDLRGHEGSVFSVSFMPMGNSLLSLGEDRLIKVWKTDINKLVQTYRGHATYIPSLKYSPDGRFLVSSSWDNTVKLWNVGQEILHSSFGDSRSVSYSVAFSPDGQFIATGDSDGFIRMWNPVNGKMLSALKGHSDQISSIAFSNDGNYLVSGSRDKTVGLWDMSKRKTVKIFAHQNPVHAVAISKDSKIMVSAGRNGEINFWNIPDGKLIFGSKEGKTILSVDFSPDGFYAIAAVEDGTVTKWSMKDKKMTEVLHGHSGAVNAVSYSADGTLFASVGREVIIRSGKTAEKLLSFDLQYNGYSIDFEKDGRHFSVSDGALIKRYPVILEMWKEDPDLLMKDAELRAGKRLEGFKLVPISDKILVPQEDLTE